MFTHPKIHFIITYNPSHKKSIKEYLAGFGDIFSKRRLLYSNMPLFTEREVKEELRRRISLRQPIVDEIYEYTGTFPHLLHLYDKWKTVDYSIDKQSKIIARTFSDEIFDYFRELSLNARLLIATCLYENLIPDKIKYTTFYNKFPLFKLELPKDKLEKTIDEIVNYGSGLSGKTEANAFQLSISNNAKLFSEAVKHISWIVNFYTLNKFTSAPTWVNAYKMARTFTNITRSDLEIKKAIEHQTEKYKDKFYIGKFSEHGMQALKMPLTTFIVISLAPWQKDVHTDVFHDLYIDFQEFCRKAGESIMFYILLFELHGASKNEVKEELEDVERISIIDAAMMKDIILTEAPKEKASQYIFEQLGIRERSPYTTAGAVPDSLFFGRHMEISLIRDLPENIGVFGTRTIGKTSLLRKLRKAFQSKKRWRVYDMDCSRIESEESLLKNLAEKMEVSFDRISTMEKFRRYVTTRAGDGGYRYLFLLDEVDRLVQYDLEHKEKIFNTFNRLCNDTIKDQETAARFILFGFQQMFEQMKNPLSRLYNFMVFLPLQALDMESAMNLVTRPIEDIQVRWDNKADAKYLVDSCSRHPRLLQAACHALLTNLDSKSENKDTIERADVDKALTSQAFREICMRLYHTEEKDNYDNGKEGKKENWKKSFLKRKHRQETESLKKEIPPNLKQDEPFLNDLHRITILSAIRLLFAEEKKVFTITDIQQELQRYKIDVSPNVMRKILERLCLSGNFRLLDESNILAKEDSKLLETAEKINKKMNIGHPDVYKYDESTIPKFSYEFGIKIFPKLLVAHFGGIKQCEEERQELIEKGAWKEWLGRQ